MANTLTWFYVIFSWVSITVNIALIGALFRSFLKKKTTGTLILFASYLMIGIGALIGAIVYTLEIFSTAILSINILQTIATLLPLVGLLLIYIFSCRHILKDNEIVKSFHLIIISLAIGIILMIYLMGVLNLTPQLVDYHLPEGESALWYQIVRTDISNTGLYNIAVTSTSFIITGIQLYINIRIIARSFIEPWKPGSSKDIVRVLFSPGCNNFLSME